MGVWAGELVAGYELLCKKLKESTNLPGTRRTSTYKIDIQNLDNQAAPSVVGNQFWLGEGWQRRVLSKIFRK